MAEKQGTHVARLLQNEVPGYFPRSTKLMPQVEVTTTQADGPVAKGLLADFDRLMRSIRRRAYELFECRGRTNGADLEDWFQAEAELLFPLKIETTEEPGKCTLRVSLPGFFANDLKVYTLGSNLVLKGAGTAKSETDKMTSERNQDVFYQWPLPAGAQSDQIKADYKEGTLTISIPVDAQPKSVQSETSEPKSSSATAAAA
jgi:HSP20 family protein